MAEMVSAAAVEGAARKAGKSIARAMLLAALTMKNHYAGAAPTYAWLARKALTTRPRWTQINEHEFAFTENGQKICIADDLNLLQVIHLIVEVEVGWSLDSHDPWRREELLRLAHAEADAFILKT